MFNDMFDFQDILNASKSKSDTQEITRLKLEVVAARKDSDDYRARLNKALALLKNANARIEALEAEKGTLQLTVESQTIIITTLSENR